MCVDLYSLLMLITWPTSYKALPYGSNIRVILQVAALLLSFAPHMIGCGFRLKFSCAL